MRDLIASLPGKTKILLSVVGFVLLLLGIASIYWGTHLADNCYREAEATGGTEVVCD